MNVVDRSDDGVFLLLPEDDWEGINNLFMFSKAGIGGKLFYGGRMNEGMSIFFSIKLKTDDEQIVVKGTTEGDKRNIGKIRSLCFHTMVDGMILHGFVPTEYGIGLTLTAVYCINCGKPMNERIGWRICRDCAEEICPHETYERRMISDDEGMFLCKVCMKCGIPDPVDFLRTRGFNSLERIREIQELNPATFIPVGMNPRKLPLAVAAALRSNN